jgi:hypothetical protein
VIATDREIVSACGGITAAFNLANATPKNVGRIPVLFIAGHYAAFAAYATGHIEMETILFAGCGRPK